MGAAFTSLPRYRHFLSEQEGPLKKPYMPGDEGWRETVSTFLSSRRCARFSSVIPNFAGCSGGQLINSREERSQNWGCVCLVVSDDQINGRRLAFEGTAGHGPR
jgi:hypothetical protein